MNVLLHSLPPTLQQATSNPHLCWRLLDTPGKVWVSLLWGSLILSCKSWKSRNTWSNRQIWPWSAEWSRTKANRVLQRELTGHSKHPLPTTRKDYTWTPPDGHTEIRLIIFFVAKDREALYSQQKQHWELTVAQIMNPLLPNRDLNWRK